MKTKRTRKKSWPRKVNVGNASVTVYRRRRADGSPGFELADYTEGRRRLRSFPTAKKALAEADRIAALLAAGEAHAAQFRGREAAMLGRCMELARPTGDPLELIVSRYAEVVRILGDGALAVEAARFFKERNPDNLPFKTVAEVVTELLAAKEARGASKRYLQDLRARANRFAEAFKVGIADVTTPDVQAWLDGLKGSPRTAKNFRGTVGTLFSFAEARGFLVKGQNPVKNTERISAGNGKAIEIFTPEEIARLLAAAGKDFRPCLAIGAFAGLRSAEIERLEWSDVDLAGGHITVTAAKAKTASRRLVPIAANLAAWLAPYARRQGKIWRGKHDEFYEAEGATAAATGKDGKEPVAWKANGLRHSFISYRLAQVQSAAQVALEAGNSPQMVFRHYRELVKPAQAAAWFAVSPKQAANVVTMKAQAA